MINYSFSIGCLGFMVLLFLVCIIKKVNLREENRIYFYIVISSLIGITADSITYFMVQNGVASSDTIFEMLTRFVLLYYDVYCILFILYIFMVCNRKKKMQEENKLAKKVLLGVFIPVFIIANLILPITFHVDENMLYPEGINVFKTYIFAFVSIIYITIYLLKNKKYIISKEFIPLILLIIFSTFAIIIQFMFQGLMILTWVEAFITFVMYFTIENPDVQMLNEFHKVREKEEKSNDAKNEFLVNISKDIKTPIANIKAITSEALNSNDPEVLKNEIRRIQTSTGELSQIVSNILDISELEKQKLGIKMNKYQVHNLFNMINKSFEKTIDDNIEYRFNYDNSIPEYLYGDSIRLKQIMNILLDNAKDYTKKGFIEVNVNSIIKNDICRLIITVEDSGSGITSEELEHLFDKEKIYSDETLKLIDDTKNNLGIAKSLIDLMNGSITVKSELGSGSKFTIVIDQIIKEEEKTKIEETVDQYEKMLEKKKKILLVISSSDLSKKINLYLKKQPYDIVEVIGGQPCLERLRNKEKYNIILMEENLEKLSSEDTLIKIKDTPGYKIPVVLISNNKGFGAKEMYQEKGFKDVIFMPIKKNELLEIIKENS